MPLLFHFILLGLDLLLVLFLSLLERRVRLVFLLFWFLSPPEWPLVESILYLKNDALENFLIEDLIVKRAHSLNCVFVVLASLL